MPSSERQRLIDLARRIPGPTRTIELKSESGRRQLLWSETGPMDRIPVVEEVDDAQDWVTGDFVVRPVLRRWDGELIDSIALLAIVSGEESGIHDKDGDPLDTVFIWIMTYSPGPPLRKNLPDEARAGLGVIGRFFARELAGIARHRTVRVVGTVMSRTTFERAEQRESWSARADMPPLVIPKPEV